METIRSHNRYINIKSEFISINTLPYYIIKDNNIINGKVYKITTGYYYSK